MTATANRTRSLPSGTVPPIPSTLLGLLLSLLVLAVCPARPAQAQEKADKVFELGEVVVTGNKAAAEEVATVTERDQEDFRAWSDYSVADALRGIPGGQVSVSRGSLPGNGKQESLVRLRGFETTDILIMIDGMPFTEPYMKRVDLNQILLDNVAKIKVIKGPSSVLYGPNTSGGIINIVTQEGDEFRTTVDQRFGDYQNFRTRLHHRGFFGPVRYTLGGSYDHSNGFPISGDFEGARNQQGTLRENSDYERYNFNGRVGVDLGSSGSLSVAGGYYDYDGGVPYDMADVNPSTLWRKGWKRWYVSGAGEWSFTDALCVKAQIYYDNFDNEIKTYTDTGFDQVASDGRAVSTYENSLFGYFLNPYWDLGRASFLRAGIRYQKEDVSIQPSKGDPWEDYSAETFSFALEDEVRPLPPLSLVAGVGYSVNRKLEAYHQNPGDDIDAVHFQVGLLYTPWSWLKAHASVARKTSFPTMRQLYSEIGGNPDLNEQTALIYEIGIEGEYRPGYPGGSLTLYRSEVDDLIGKRELGTEFVYENVDEAEMQGVELALHWEPLEPLGFLLAYTYTDTEDKRPDRVLKQLDFRPRHLLSLELRYRASFGLTVNSRYTYTGPQKYEQKGVIPPVVRTLPSRGLWDIHVAQKIPLRAEADRYLKISLAVDNILDTYYEEDPGKAAPGRTVWAGIHACF